MAKNEFNDLARDIIDNVGGEENVDGLRHCITRLRFNLKDESIANTDYLKQRDGVVTVMKSNGQYQVVIGERVGEVYEAIMEESTLSGGTSSQGDGDNNPENKQNIVDRFIDFISGVFQPFLMVLAATGMIKGLVALLGAFGLAPTSGLYQILNFAGDAFFQFLPIMVAITAARKLKMNEFTALAISVAFLHPNIMTLMEGEALYTLFAGTAIESTVFSTFLGIPIILPANGYFSAIIPILVAVWLGSKVEKWMKNIIPGLVRSFLTPFFTVLITFPIALIVIGPIATWASALIAEFFIAINGFSPLLFGALLAFSWQLLVIFGVHWSIIPIGFVLLAEQEFEPILTIVNVSVFGVLGVVIALLIKSNDKKIRDIGIPSVLSLIFGVSEPTIYGLMLPLRKSFIYALIANLLAGAYMGATNVVGYRTGGLGIFAVFSTIETNGTIGMNFWNTIIGFVIAVGVGFAIQMVMPVPSLETDTDKESHMNTSLASNSEIEESAKEDIIASPVKGKVLPLTDVQDEVFSGGALGEGLAVQPEEGEVRAPANGVITTIFPTGHAVGITTDEGSEILIHIGLDTVDLEGKHYEKLVEQEATVKAGDPLIRFDIEGIKAEGYDIVTPIIVTNTADFDNVSITEESTIDFGDYLLTTSK